MEYSAHSFPSFRSGKADQLLSLATKDKIQVGVSNSQGSSVQRLKSCDNYSGLLYCNSNSPI